MLAARGAISKFCDVQCLRRKVYAPLAQAGGVSPLRMMIMK